MWGMHKEWKEQWHIKLLLAWQLGEHIDFTGGPFGELWINQTKRTSIADQLRNYIIQYDSGNSVEGVIKKIN